MLATVTLYNVTMNHEIIPAVMPDSFTDIESAAVSVRGSAQTIQLDLMDGKYVPESTWPFHVPGGRDLQGFAKGELGLPLWEDINYELDLMVSKPEEQMETWLSLGASRIIFHYASVNDWNIISDIDQVSRNFLEIGVAVTIHDDLEKIYQLLDDGVVDFVQFMGIASIGFQGEPFEAGILEKISELRRAYPDIIISIDGGVGAETIPLLHEAGVNRFVSGSGVFGHGLPKENIDILYQVLES